MSRSPGRYHRSRDGYAAFIPNSLPPDGFHLSSEVERKVEEATHRLGQVEMCRTLLPNADLLIYSSLQREALASSTIEGTIASPDELVLFQISHRSPREAVREVANYRVALEWGCEQISARPVIGERLILGLHERLLSGVRGSVSAGRFKSAQNYIGSRPDDPIESAVFVPPPPEMVADLITLLQRYINLSNRHARVVQCALTHYQFETIHPFHDGNGRVGRLLIVLQMIQLNLLSAPLIYPSVYFERKRQDYYSLLQAVRDSGMWQQWVEFFVEGVIQQCKETIMLTRTILELRAHLHEEISNVRRRASLNAVLDSFFHDPVLTLPQISGMAHMARNSAQAAVDELQSAGLLREISGKERGRIYACLPVLDAIFGGHNWMRETGGGG